MIKGLRTAEKAMNIQLNRTNVLANNLANANSVGFKQLLMNVSEEKQDNQNVNTPERMDSARDMVLNVQSPLDMRQGALRETGNVTDVAIRGEGFFKVSRDGSEFYTRNGSFTINSQRQLITMNGDTVQGTSGPLTVPDGVLVISENGTLTVGEQSVGKLELYAFENTADLELVGESRYKVAEEVEARKLKAAEVDIAQGMLEQSNVNTIDTMVAMIAAQRAFELESKVLESADRTLDKAVNELARKA
ncbi:flagellar hook basal-body protein [bacterium]|jgi:flagellar basal-body rod protein FlgG|nr:flagellar hook basal-body protein [bacterium]MBT4292330.1 flagellar hook basal-body protein [bacterium]MBT7310406.1 flagellar hook basal-body protein [bacterium]